MNRAPWAIALAAFLTFAFTAGGRITGTDELTQLDLARALRHGSIEVPAERSVAVGADGRVVSKNTWGQALLAFPLVALGDLAGHAAGFRAERAELATRFVASFFNAIVTALMLAAAYVGMRSLRVGPRASFAATVLLGFTTPVWVAAKSFAAEPVEALGLLLVVVGGAKAGAAPDPREQRQGEWWAGIGAFLALLVKVAMGPVVGAGLLAIGFRRLRAWRLPLAWLAAALASHALYNWMRFGNVLASGYGGQQSLEAFGTPLLVGVYGLLLSSGKGVLWFAPMTGLVPHGIARMIRARQHSDAARRGEDARNAGRAIVAAWAVSLVFFGKFQHWGGDGSWGPRYLGPVLPLAGVAVGFALDGASKLRKRIAWALATIGLVVTLGGVGIYFGAQMREAGDYPYTLALDDPHFMEASHWNPRYSPIAGHWGMLGRNFLLHIRGQAPALRAQNAEVDPRTGITHEEEQALLHAIDVWWLYAGYAGIPKLPLGIAAVVLLAGSVWAWARAWAAVREEHA